MQVTITRPIATRVSVTVNGASRSTVSRTVSRATHSSIGLQGPKGDAGANGISAGPAYVHTQSLANSSWTIAHNLNRNPMVELIVGGAIVNARVTFPTLDSALVEFSTAVTGTANCF